MKKIIVAVTLIQKLSKMADIKTNSKIINQGYAVILSYHF